MNILVIFRLFEQEQDDEIIVGHLKSALELDPDNDEARNMLIKIHQRSKKVIEKGV